MGTKILVVDDDRNICELLKLYLENEGYSVFVANDGQQAVEMFQAKSPELVLLDIMLPKMDGWQVCREIRKVSNAPIIMLTAKGETFDKVLGLELGADDYVTKPFDAKEVMARVKAVLRRTSGNNEADENSKKVVTYDNLEIQNPYNTYKYPGLPPSPISNPGFTAISAALNPQESSYLYFTLTDSENGTHTFSNDLNSHVKATNQFRTKRMAGN